MRDLLRWFKTHKFESHTLAFITMLLTAAGLYAAAQNGSSTAIGLLLPIFILSNVLVIWIG